VFAIARFRLRRGYVRGVRTPEGGFNPNAFVFDYNTGALSAEYDSSSSITGRLISILYPPTLILAFSTRVIRWPRSIRLQRRELRTGSSRAGGCFLYTCEDGLVHYRSQQRGHPAIPLERYTFEDLEREAAREKACAPYCTISCVHQTVMLDAFRDRPKQVLSKMIAARQDRNPEYQPPALLNALTWTFLDGPMSALGKVALRVLKAR
jgi:hypothetical protein